MAEQTVKNILNNVDIKIGGNRDWDIKVHDKRFYSKVLAQGSLGLGESYIDGWWDCKKIDVLIAKLLSAKLEEKYSAKMISSYLKARILNQQNKKRSKKVGIKHYDIGNDLYKKMLDKNMIYSCAYWKNAKNLDAAQEAKLDLICKKLKLKPGMTVLDIGCGWGGLAKFMAKKYKARVVGITISKEQAKLARKNCKGLPVEIRLQDYRDVKESFDRVVSVGMIEHVGYKNYKTFMKAAFKSLKNGGLFLLHTIGSNKSGKTTDPWIAKYIFPNSMIPSASQLITASEGLFVLEDWHNFGPDYDKTLMEWHKNFNKYWDTIKNNYDEKFKRMWNYYLLACAGSFRVKKNNLWQIVFSKNYFEKYNSIR